MNQIQHSNVFLYWQPPNHVTYEERLQSIEEVKPFISNVHLFHWYSFNERMALSEGKNEWQVYLEKIQEDNKPRNVLMEFIREDSTEQFFEDAKVLHALRNVIE